MRVGDSSVLSLIEPLGRWRCSDQVDEKGKDRFDIFMFLCKYLFTRGDKIPKPGVLNTPADPTRDSGWGKAVTDMQSIRLGDNGFG